MLQALCSALSIFLLAELAHRIAGRRAGLLAAAVLALHGLSIYFCGELLVTTLIITLDLGFLLSFLAAEQRGRPRLFLVSGLLLGLSVITRPTVLLAAPLGFIWILVRRGGAGARGVGRLKLAAPPAALFLLGVVLPILPVSLTNLLAGGEGVLLATQGGLNFYIGNNAEASGAHASLPPFGTAWKHEDAKALAESEIDRRLSASEVSSFYFHKGLEFIRDNPGDWLALMVKKTALFWNRAEIGSNRSYSFASRDSLVLRLALPVGFAFIGPLGLAGLVMLLGRKGGARSPLLFLALFTILYMVGVVVFFVNARFRMPVIPLLILFGSVFVLRTVDEIRARKFPRLAAIAVAAAALLAWWPAGVTASSPAFGYFGLGASHLEKGNLVEARASFRRALEENPNFPQARLSIGVTFLKEGNLDAAAEAFHGELELNPASEKAMYNLGVVSRDAGELDQAILWVRGALEVKPWFPEAKSTLAALLSNKGIAEVKQGLLPTALSLFSEAVELDGSTPIYRYNLALALARCDRQEESLDQLRQALEIDPDFAPARERLEALWRQDGIR